MSDLSGLIRQKREAEGLSLREAGAASGVAFSTLGRIENGAPASLAVHQRILAWLNGQAPVLPPPPMTLRDWFAGQALAMSQPDGPENLAEWSYRVADAMLKARRAANKEPI